MIIKSLDITNFRNYSRSRIFFDDNLNIIAGDNAQGKTNLIEAVFYLTMARSFRSRNDSELVLFGENFLISMRRYFHMRETSL